MAQKAERAIIAKLKAKKDEKSGSYEFPLPESDVVATIPKFINHGRWMAAQRIAKGDNAKAQAAFVCETVLFDGEQLTITDLAELMPAGDTLSLIGEIFGGEDGEGNGTKTA